MNKRNATAEQKEMHKQRNSVCSSVTPWKTQAERLVTSFRAPCDGNDFSAVAGRILHNAPKFPSAQLVYKWQVVNGKFRNDRKPPLHWIASHFYMDTKWRKLLKGLCAIRAPLANKRPPGSSKIWHQCLESAGWPSVSTQYFSAHYRSVPRIANCSKKRENKRVTASNSKCFHRRLLSRVGVSCNICSKYRSKTICVCCWKLFAKYDK